MKILCVLLLSCAAFAQVVPHKALRAKVSPSNHTVTLSCEAGTGSPVAFQFYRGTQTGGPYVNISGDQTSCNYVDADPTLKEGQTYYYVATDSNAEGQVSAYSNESSATVPFLPPGPPTGLSTVAK